MSTLTIDAPAYALEIRRADTTSPTRARRWLTWCLESAGITQDTVESCVLAVSELVTNAVLYAGGRVLVSAQQDPDGVRLIVHDQGTADAWPQPADGLGEHGRGLAIVAGLATELDITTDAAGTTVSALIPTAA